jgi:hypothetical protein
MDGCRVYQDPCGTPSGLRELKVQASPYFYFSWSVGSIWAAIDSWSALGCVMRVNLEGCV